MEKETAVREWCIERAIELKGGIWNPTSIIACAKQLEAYISGTEPQPQEARRFSLVVSSDGNIKIEE